MILLFKYRDGEGLGRDLAGFTWEALRGDEPLWKGAELVLPVPLHRRRQWERGFNQAAVLAGHLAAFSGLRMIKNRLVRRRAVLPQAGLDSEERRRNVSGAFAVRRSRDIAGRVLLLVDDVFTTGSTAGECCRVLRRAGAREVRVLTVARAQD